ncbi:MAG: hypothetical protein ACREOI_04375 [bacterium]
MKIKIIFAIFLVFAAIMLFSPAASFACPGCNAALRDLGRAFNPSVLFMMAMPFAVVGAIAGGLVYAYWRAQKQTSAQEDRLADAMLPQENE